MWLVLTGEESKLRTGLATSPKPVDFAKGLAKDAGQRAGRILFVLQIAFLSHIANSTIMVLSRLYFLVDNSIVPCIL